MKKAFILFLSTLVLCFACKRGNTPSEQPHGIKPEESSRIKELKVDGDDVLSLMDKNNEVTLESVPVHKDVVSVYVLPHNPSAEIVVSNTGKRVDELDGNIYEVHLFYGKNTINVTITSEKDGARQYKINIHRDEYISLASFVLDGVEYYDKNEDEIKDKSIIFPSDKEKVQLKIKAGLDGTELKVKLKDKDIEKAGDTYILSLEEGENALEVRLSISTLTKTYWCILYKQENLAPNANEVIVEVNVSDGVNGSYVEGTYLNIYKTKNSATLIKHSMVVHGKTKVVLEKNVFYDFKLEGGVSKINDVHYAASNIISYYIDDDHKIVSMVQPVLSYITKPSVAPKMEEFKMEDDIIEVGSEIAVENIKNFTIKLETASTIEEFRNNAPPPLLGIGFVPTTLERDKVYVLSGNLHAPPTKNNKGTYDSTWSFHSSSTLVKGTAFDIVVVAYDIANNRLEYHVRIKTEGTLEEKDDILISDLRVEFIRYPTASSIFSVGQDGGTGNSTHYNAALVFRCKKGDVDVYCIGFDIYRKCISDGESGFRLVKHFLYNHSQVSHPASPHVIFDNDSLLEDGKTYVYKLVAYIDRDKKSMLSKSPEVTLAVPKSTVILLDYPSDVSISQSKAKNLGYVLKLTPDVLKKAKEMSLGLIISDRQGLVYYASKFRYVFKDIDDRPELYFAIYGDIKTDVYGLYTGTEYSKKRNTLTDKSVEELVKIDKETGSITITKDFLNITRINLAEYGRKLPYNPGDTYYWDVVDWGASEYDLYDDQPITVISGEANSIIVNMCSDSESGNNAWNGKACFSVKKN